MGIALRPGLKVDYWRRGYMALEIIPVEIIEQAKIRNGLEMWRVKRLDGEGRHMTLTVSAGSLHVPEDQEVS